MKFNQRTFCAFSYVAALVIGLSIFADFGVSWDERYHLEYGEVVFDHIFKGAPLATSGDQIFYGPLFDLSAHIVLKAFRLEDTRSILLGKHLITFLCFWIALFFFYKLCKRYFGNWIPAYIACLFLIIHPRIFAESFYNPKDLPFLSLFAIGCFSLYWYLERRTIARGIIHGLVCAVCIDVRILGIMIPFLTVFLTMLEALEAHPGKGERPPTVLSLAAYIGAVVFFSVLFWPYLWHDPVGKFLNAVNLMSAYPYRWAILYKGALFTASALPWHYIPVWILITTPVSIFTLFVVGNFGIVGVFKRLFGRSGEHAGRGLLPYLWFWGPLVAVILLHGSVYNGWRHLYFIYPAMVMIAVRGGTMLWGLISSLERPLLRKATTGALLLAMSLDLMSVVIFMARAHPNQCVYFNSIVGGLAGTEGRFEWDYFGVAHRQLLEGLLRNHRGVGPIPIVGTEPTYNNLLILKPEERRRFRFVALVPTSKRYLDPARLGQREAVYYCSNLRGGVIGGFAGYPTVSAVHVGKSTIAVAVKVVPNVAVGGNKH